MNPFLATTPFDLYELSLFHLVAKLGSFTQAGREAGLTQSAVTRQIKGMENGLGVTLFERTTRKVRLTPAGRLLFEKSKAIVSSTEETLREVQTQFGLLPKTLIVGVSRSIGLAYYPGFFFSFRRKCPEVQLHVIQESGREILKRLEEGSLDAGLLSPPERLPRALRATHIFDDQFVLIAPTTSAIEERPHAVPLRSLKKMLLGERWLLLGHEDDTGAALSHWLQDQGLPIQPAMEMDSFDVIVNLVALGLGVSMVPHRVLALYGERRKVRRIATKPRFQRKLAVVIRKRPVLSETLAAFIGEVLF